MTYAGLSFGSIIVSKSMCDSPYPAFKPMRRACSHKRSRSRQLVMITRTQIVSMKAERNPATLLWRARRADMSRAGFVGLMAGWTGFLALILFVSAFIRFVG